MVKNVQLKIILIFAIIATVLLVGISTYFLVNLRDINNFLLTQNSDIQQATSKIAETINQGGLLSIYLVFAFLVISIVIAIFVVTKITIPMNRLIDSARKIATGEEVRFGKEKKKK